MQEERAYLAGAITKGFLYLLVHAGVPRLLLLASIGQEIASIRRYNRLREIRGQVRTTLITANVNSHR